MPGPEEWKRLQGRAEEKEGEPPRHHHHHHHHNEKPSLTKPQNFFKSENNISPSSPKKTNNTKTTDPNMTDLGDDHKDKDEDEEGDPWLYIFIWQSLVFAWQNLLWLLGSIIGFVWTVVTACLERAVGYICYGMLGCFSLGGLGALLLLFSVFLPLFWLSGGVGGSGSGDGYTTTPLHRDPTPQPPWERRPPVPVLLPLRTSLYAYVERVEMACGCSQILSGGGGEPLELRGGGPGTTVHIGGRNPIHSFIAQVCGNPDDDDGNNGSGGDGNNRQLSSALENLRASSRDSRILRDPFDRSWAHVWRIDQEHLQPTTDIEGQRKKEQRSSLSSWLVHLGIKSPPRNPEFQRRLDRQAISKSLLGKIRMLLESEHKYLLDMKSSLGAVVTHTSNSRVCDVHLELKRHLAAAIQKDNNRRREKKTVMTPHESDNESEEKEAINQLSNVETLFSIPCVRWKSISLDINKLLTEFRMDQNLVAKHIEDVRDLQDWIWSLDEKNGDKDEENGNGLSLDELALMVHKSLTWVEQAGEINMKWGEALSA